MIHAVFLDVGWTLAYPRRSMWEIFAQLCTEAGVPTTPAACETLIRMLWRVGQEHAERQFHAGARYPDSDEEFAGMFGQMGGVIFGQLGVADSDGGSHAERMQQFFRAFWQEDNWIAFPEVLEVLGALRARGVKLGVLSNAPTNLPSFLDRLGVSPFLDFAVVSASEGVKKPDRRIFEIALSRAGIPAAQALHVGDMYLEDIVGGGAAGLNTLLMERGPRALFPSYRESEGRALDPETVVRNLHQVLERVSADPSSKTQDPRRK